MLNIYFILHNKDVSDILCVKFIKPKCKEKTV